MAEQIPLKAVKSSGVATALAEMEVGDYSAAAYLPPVFGDYIGGLVLEWVSGTSLRVTGGSAYIPSLGYVINSPTAITKSSLALSATTWYHVYLFLNAGVPDIEIVATAPEIPYSGVARSKAGDSSRRYLGSVRTDAAGAIFCFLQVGLDIVYLIDTAQAPFRVLAAGTATTPTSVSCSAVVPVTSQRAICTATNQTNVGMRILESVGIYGATGRIYGMSAGANSSLPIPLNPAQEFLYYLTAAPTGSAVIECTGYTYGR